MTKSKCQNKSKIQITNSKKVLSFDICALIFICHLCFGICHFNLYANEPVPLYRSGKGKFTIPFGRSYNYSDILVTRAVDGDTLVLETRERVRLIGMDTPEMHESAKLFRDASRTKQDIKTIQALGRRAYEFTKNLVEGKRVKLEFDLEKHDKYGRLLAYVYLKDGTFVNAEIVKEGYASLMTYPPNVKYVDLFLNLYREAREDRRGLWK
jgi:micrococcal nuclease